MERQNQIKTRVDATQDKIELLIEMKSMLNTLRAFAARVEDKINVMIDTDLASMQAEKEILEEMENTIKNGTKS